MKIPAPVENMSPYLARFALLLWLISPIVEEIEWLLVVTFVLIIFSFLIFFVCSIQVAIRDKSKFIPFLWGKRHDNIYDAMIAIAGIIAYFAVRNEAMLLVWILLLVSTALDFFFPNTPR